MLTCASSRQGRASRLLLHYSMLVLGTAWLLQSEISSELSSNCSSMCLDTHDVRTGSFLHDMPERIPQIAAATLREPMTHLNVWPLKWHD